MRRTKTARADAPRISIQRAYAGTAPTRQQLVRWARGALAARRSASALTIRIVGKEEGAALNLRWRGKKSATNVLSFPVSGLEAVAPELLGDIVICAPVVADEARAHKLSLQAHWAHMVVHGTLHLLGYDHIQANDASRMESLETALLVALGFDDPYANRR